MKISFNDFDAIFNRLDARFNRGTKQEARKIYFDDLSGVPHDAWMDIVRKSCRDFKTFPTPGELLQLWYEYLKTHPELVEPDVIEEECNYCDSFGFLIYTRPDRGPWYELISKCPHCRNLGDNKFVPNMDRQQIQAKGYTVVDRCLDKPSYTIKDMGTLVDKATGEIMEDLKYEEWLKTQE